MLSIVQNIDEYSSSFIIHSVNVWNLFLQSLYDFLTADRKMFEKRSYNKEFLAAMLKNSLVKGDIKSISSSEILSFGPSTDRRYFEGYMFHIFLDWLFLPEVGLNTNRIVFIESISPSVPHHFKNSYSKNLIFEEPIMLKILFTAKFIEQRVKTAVRRIFEQIKFPDVVDKEEFTKVFSKQIARYFATIRVYRKLLKKTSVKYIFMINYYSTTRRAIVKVAKDLGIKVVEIQHGLISPTHVAYIQKDPKNFDDVPDYVLLFGDFYKDIILNHSELFREDQLFVVGNYYIETVKNAPPDLPDDLKKLKKGKKPIILLTSQTIFSRDVYKPYIEKILNTRKYHLIIKNHPGDLKDKFKIYENHPDVTVISDPSISLYELLKIVDIHITVNSTSAIEALMFGVPSLILRYMGYEKVIQFLIDGKNVIEVDVDNLIENLEKLRKIRVEDIGNKFLRSNFLDNIKVFLQVLGG